MYKTQSLFATHRWAHSTAEDVVAGISGRSPSGMLTYGTHAGNGETDDACGRITVDTNIKAAMKVFSNYEYFEPKTHKFVRKFKFSVISSKVNGGCCAQGGCCARGCSSTWSCRSVGHVSKIHAPTWHAVERSTDEIAVDREIKQKRYHDMYISHSSSKQKPNQSK